MWRIAWLVSSKDLRIEWRSRVLLWQVVPFGAMALVLSALAIGPDTRDLRRAAPGLFYLVMLLVALLMIGRSQAIESRAGTRTSVQMLGLDPAGVFLGKAGALFIELVVMSVLLLTGVVGGLHASLHGTIAALPSIVMALAAMAAGGTIYGAVLLLKDISKLRSSIAPPPLPRW